MGTMANMLRLLCFSLAVLLIASPAFARPEVNLVRFGVAEERTRMVVESDAPLSYSLFTLAGQGDRIVIDLAPVTWSLDGVSLADGQRARPGEGLVSRVRFAHFSEQKSRIVLDLTRPARVMKHFPLSPQQPGDVHRLVLDLEPTDRNAFNRSAGFPMLGVSAAPRAPASSAKRVIVIDPGHGGHDPGAIGVTGAKEKEVNLGVALLLKAELEKTGSYTVVLTREDDTFLDHPERVQLAREAGADLFISIHADSLDAGRSARGASVYTLAEDASYRQKSEILQDNNWLIDVDLSEREQEVSDILIDLAQRQTRNQSDTFAETLIPELRKAGPVLRNTHRNAGYFVLLAPDVPAVLLEVGFLSDARDEALLKTTRHRKKLARAVSHAITTYFNNADKLYAPL